MSWQQIVKQVAPVLGTALGGPFAGTAAKFIAGKLFGDESASDKDIAEQLAIATPEQLAHLKDLDNEFKLKMRELDIDVYALEVDNAKSARELAKTNMWPQIILSALFVSGYFVVLTFLIKDNIKLSDSVMIVFGVITAAIPQILNFWFGSSFGSKEKTALMRVKA